MSQSIHKYSVELSGHQRLRMPRGAEILSVQPQRDRLCVWALHDSRQQMVYHELVVLGTGQTYDGLGVSGGSHLATVQMGSMVWHVFDMGES